MRATAGVVTAFLVAASMAIAAQQSAAATLTLQDYNDIQQLYARYAHGIDTHADEGAMYAATYTEDGVLDVGTRKYEGRAALTALAKPPGDPTLVHVVSNIAIQPSSDGARVVANMTQMTLGEAGKPPTIRGFGRYEDTVVRTPDGWRFKYKKWTTLSAPAKPAVSR